MQKDGLVTQPGVPMFESLQAQQFSPDQNEFLVTFKIMNYYLKHMCIKFQLDPIKIAVSAAV